MAKHKYDGDWRYFENPDGGDDVFTEGEKMKLRIPKEDGIVDEGSSSHHGKKVSGKARNNGVNLSRDGNKRALYGVTMFEIPLSSGEVFVVIKGRFRDETSGLAPNAQNEGDWVITKP